MNKANERRLLHKRGHFYFGKNRTFLNWFDRQNKKSLTFYLRNFNILTDWSDMNQYSEKEKKKEMIIKAAYKAVIEKGINSLTLQDIADRAYVSKGITLYYFKNKDDILLSLLEWVKSKIMDKLNSEVEKTKDPVDKAKALVNAWFNGLKVNKRFYLLYLEFLSNKGLRDERFKELSISFYKEYNRIISNIVLEGIDKEVFRKIDPKVAVSVIWGLIDGLSAQLLFEKGSHIHENYKKNCEEAILIYLNN